MALTYVGAIRSFYRRNGFPITSKLPKELENVDLNPCRPHALRSAFSTTLKLKGFDPNLVDFMMGHRLPYGGAYLIPPEEKVREMYREVERYLSISGDGYIEKELQQKLSSNSKTQIF